MVTALFPHPNAPRRLPIPIRAVNDPFTACMLIPTGIGASMGGFGGDASLVLNLLAHSCERLLTHPNVANAAVLQNLPTNVQYVEGYALDKLMTGMWALRPMAHQRIGVVLDAGLPENVRILSQNAIAAMQTVHGVEVVAVVQTMAPVEMRLTPMVSSHTMGGEITNPLVLIEAAQTLISHHGATAIALGVLFPEMDMPEESAYRQAAGADPIGALEALLSHTVVAHCHVPCAHAPILRWEDAQPEIKHLLDPRLAAEFIAPTFLPCVLTGLRQAPQLITDLSQAQPGDLTQQQVHAVVVPVDALGGVPVLAALECGIPVITVGENTTVLSVLARTLFGETSLPPHLLHAHTYAEAAGFLLAMRYGLPVPLFK